MLEVFAELPEYGIQFHADENRFGIHGLRMSFCMFCGGKLPEEDHAHRPFPDREEELAARAVIESVKSIDGLIDLLGEPDESLTSDDCQIPLSRALDRLVERYPESYVVGPEGHWTRFVRYWSRWPSLYLDVYEFPDGRIEHAIWGQDPNAHHPPEEQKWWARWLRRRDKAF